MDNIAYFMLLLPTIFFIFISAICGEYTGGSKCFYGVKIDGLDLSKEDKFNIRNQYKKSIKIISIIFLLISALVVYILGDNFQIVMNLLFLGYAVLIVLCQFRAYGKTKKLRDKLIKEIDYEENTTPRRTIALDTCLLNERVKLKNKFRIIFLILIFISSISILYLAITYNEMPKLIPTDFAGDSTPIDFVVKNLKTVFGVEVAGFIMISLLGFIVMICIGNVESTTKDNLENSRKQVLKYINKIGNSFVLIGLCIELQTTIMPIILFNQYKFHAYVIIFAWLLIMATLINILYCYIMLSSLKVKQKFNYSNDENNWIFGYFYYNKEDPSFIVERKIGMGYTINLANQKTKALVATILLVFVINTTLNMA